MFGLFKSKLEKELGSRLYQFLKKHDSFIVEEKQSKKDYESDLTVIWSKGNESIYCLEGHDFYYFDDGKRLIYVSCAHADFLIDIAERDNLKYLFNIDSYRGEKKAIPVFAMT